MYDRSLTDAVAACRAHGQVLDQLKEIYLRADVLVAAAGATCWGGGCCCKFDIAGHKLYVSIAELTLLTEVPPPFPGRCSAGRCPYQDGPRCMARARRPLGCRVFFCDRSSQGRLEGVYEKAHGEIRRMHELACVPYVYADVLTSIMQLHMLT